VRSSTSFSGPAGRSSPPTGSSGLRSRRPPFALVALATIGLVLVGLPVLGLVLRTPWSRIDEILLGETATTALRLSLVVATIAAFVSLIAAFPLAWLLARRSFRGRALVRALVVLPLVMPPVVAGVGLLAAFGRRGILGGVLEDWFGIQLTFTTAAAVLAASFVSFPLAVLALEAGIRALDERLEDAAATLGASRWYVLQRVTIPLLAPQIAAAAVLAWARALGEFGATITFAGNLQGRTQTLPLAVFERLQTDPDAAFALSMLLIAVALAVILSLRGRFLR
jgi:molybdate transport system permease protein